MKKFALAAAAAFSLSFASAPTTASAAVFLLQPGCDLYDEGCLFTSDGNGNEFDDGALIQAAYNATHLATPAPEDLPALTFLGKIESQPSGSTGTNWNFTNLGFNVSFYVVKTGAEEFLLFGNNPADNSVQAFNTQILNKNGRNLRDISHVTFFGADGGGGGGNAIPEPATWALMIMGFGSAGAMLRRRRALVA